MTDPDRLNRPDRTPDERLRLNAISRYRRRIVRAMNRHRQRSNWSSEEMVGTAMWIAFDLACGVLAEEMGKNDPAQFKHTADALAELFAIGQTELTHVIADMRKMIENQHRPVQPPKSGDMN